MRYWIVLILSLLCLSSCATAPAEVNYYYYYNIHLEQGQEASIGDIELLLETQKDSNITQDNDPSTDNKIDPTLDLGGVGI